MDPYLSLARPETRSYSDVTDPYEWGQLVRLQVIKAYKEDGRWVSDESDGRRQLPLVSA